MASSYPDEGLPASGGRVGQPDRASGKNAQDTEGESWDEMIAHFGDTWT